MKIDHIEDLRIFAQVVDSGTLAAAGRVLGLSPTLVSRKLARLETALGVRLLERTTRSLSVTDEGRGFYARCRRVLTEVELAQDELRPASDQVSGIVRLVLPTSMLAYGIMDAVKKLLDQYPKLKLEIRLSDNSADLTGGGWDVATHIGSPKDSSHIGKRLGEIIPRLAATPEYLARAGIPETPLDLANHDCVRFSTGIIQDSWPIIDGSGETHRVPIGGNLICHDIITLYSAICSGIGIGILPYAALKKAKQDGILADVLPFCQMEGNTLYALIPTGRQGLPRIRVVVEWLTDFVQSLSK